MATWYKEGVMYKYFEWRTKNRRVHGKSGAKQNDSKRKTDRWSEQWCSFF